MYVTQPNFNETQFELFEEQGAVEVDSKDVLENYRFETEEIDFAELAEPIN